MTSKIITIALSLLACMPLEDRRQLLDVECEDGQCSGRWEDSRLRSTVHPTEELLEMPAVDLADLWECEPEPDVDYCVEVDSHGHVGCFRDHDGWSVAVAPECVAETWTDWIPVGAGMMARTLPAG